MRQEILETLSMFIHTFTRVGSPETSSGTKTNPHTGEKETAKYIKVVHRKTTTINEPYPGDLIEKDGKGDGFFKGFIISFRNEKSGSEDFEVVDWHSVRARIRFVDEHDEERAHTTAATFIDEPSWRRHSRFSRFTNC